MDQSSTDRSAMSRGAILTVAQRLTGELNLVNTEYAIKQTEETTQDQIVEAMRRIRSLGQENSVAIKFYLGDLYNAISKDYGQRKKIVEAEFGEQAYATFRNYGSIAGRWPDHTRNGKYSWNYIREHNCDHTEITKKPKSTVLQTAQVVEEENVGEGDVRLTIEDMKGNRYTVLYRSKMEHGRYMDDSKPISSDWFEDEETRTIRDYQERHGVRI